MSKVSSASGAKYSAHNEIARNAEPIAPVGTNYVPVGRVDIGALRKVPAPGTRTGAHTQAQPAVKSPPAARSPPPPRFGMPTKSIEVTMKAAPTDAWSSDDKTVQDDPVSAPAQKAASPVSHPSNVPLPGLTSRHDEKDRFVHSSYAC